MVAAVIRVEKQQSQNGQGTSQQLVFHCGMFSSLHGIAACR
jgi:hypothetical protein